MSVRTHIPLERRRAYKSTNHDEDTDSRRWHSSGAVVYALAREAAKGRPRCSPRGINACRRAGRGGTTSSRLSSTSTNTASSTCPMLQLVPSVLIMGSFFPPLTGIPLPTRSFPNQFNVHMNELYGDFYRLSVPTFGKDIQPDLNVITDPFEMQKVVQSQPPNLTTTASPKYQYPVGMLNNNGPCLDF